MQRFDLKAAGRRFGPGVAAGAIGALALSLGWTLAAHLASPKAPGLDPAATSALQHAAFTHAEARPGFAPPQSVPVKLQRGETLEAAVQRAGVAPAEAHLAVEMLAKAMDTVHIKAGMLIDAAIAKPRSERGEARLIGLSLRTGPATAITLSRSFDGALSLRELDEKIRDETTVADGSIEGSLYESAARIGATHRRSPPRSPSFFPTRSTSSATSSRGTASGWSSTARSPRPVAPWRLATCSTPSCTT